MQVSVIHNISKINLHKNLDLAEPNTVQIRMNFHLITEQPLRNVDVIAYITHYVGKLDNLSLKV
jgi:hypothetical protein